MPGTPAVLPSVWNHLQSAASTATLTHSPASPFPPLDLHFEYAAYIEEQQKRASRQLLDLQQLQLAHPPKHAASAPTSALSSPNLSIDSPTRETAGHIRKRSTPLQRLHTYHDGLARRRKTRDLESWCDPLQEPPTPRYEIWAGKAVPAVVSASSTSSVYGSSSPGASTSSSRFATTTVPSDRSGYSPQYSSHPLACSPEGTCTLPQSESALEQRHNNHQDSSHPESNPPLDGIRRVKSDLNCATAQFSHAARSRVTYHGLTQSMYAYGYYQTGPVEPISPPSSPDLAEQLNYDVSPIDADDEEWELPQQYYLKSEESSPAAKHHQQPEQHPEQHTEPHPEPHPESSVEQDSTDQHQSRSRASSSASVQRPRNNIPAMRRERRKLQDAAAKANRDQKLTGTTSNTHPDSPSGIHDLGPDMAMRGVTPDPMPVLGSTTTITAGNQQNRRAYNASPSFGERMRQFGKGKPEPIESRPAWNGASGRQAVIEPLRDDLTAAPLKINTQHTKRPHGRGQAADKPVAETSHTNSAAATVRKFMPSKSGQTANGREFTPVQPAAATFGASSSIPLASGAPTRNAAPPHETPRDGPASNGPPRTDYFNQEKAIKRKPPPSTLHAPVPTHAAQPSVSSSVYSTHVEPRSRTESPQLSVIPSDKSELTGPWAEPPPPPPAPAFSSESTTPSTSSPASPRPIPETEQAPLGGNPRPSVMDRRRPLRGKDTPPEISGEDPIVISLRTASYAHPKIEAEMGAKLQKGSRPSSIITSKDLPLAPPEMIESDDRVAVLNAKLLGLAHRRNNINRSIQQMTELMPKDTLLTSAEVQRKREDEKRKVEGLREELADIQQQEFDLGLKLHRANKRRERESEFEEGGSLWIRRITG